MPVKKAHAPLVAVVLFIAVAGATYFFHGPLYYPHVLVETQQNVSLEFLQHGLRKDESCQAAVATIADAIRASCPACRIAIRQCSGKFEPAYEKLLSEEPIEMPSSRLPRGIVAYVSDNKALALAACRETERLTGAGVPAVCYPPDTKRPFPVTPQRFESGEVPAGLMILLLACLTSVFAGHLIVRYEALHARWSHDFAHAGPQKFHSAPTPRIGGLEVMAGLFVAGAVLLAIEQSASSEQFAYLLLASLPAFAGGITEDATKNVGVLTRLLLTMLAAAFGVWLLGAVIPRLDVPGFDSLLKWTQFAIAFTAPARSPLDAAGSRTPGAGGPGFRWTPHGAAGRARLPDPPGRRRRPRDHPRRRPQRRGEQDGRVAARQAVVAVDDVDRVG